MLLGLTVGCSTQASEFLTINTIYIFAIGAGAFIIATMSGVCFVKLMNLFLPKDKKLNPLIGNAGVSAVPMAARISNNLGLGRKHSYVQQHKSAFVFVETSFNALQQLFVLSPLNLLYVARRLPTIDVAFSSPFADIQYLLHVLNSKLLVELFKEC